MLKLLFKDVLTSPARLLAVCLVVYLATLSFFVAGFLGLLALRWIHKSFKQMEKAADLAEAEKAGAKHSQPAATVPASAGVDATRTAATVIDLTSASPEPAAPKRQYAKSAVVIPLKTGTRQ
ncbi:hypothetical protein [Paraburkholderia megapolitana]|uniref:hypothetical protein n=1 Tax=Paraburkholderia megapolitana TaxID=420953 RepID=UPI0038BC8DC7